MVSCSSLSSSVAYACLKFCAADGTAHLAKKSGWTFQDQGAVAAGGGPMNHARFCLFLKAQSPVVESHEMRTFVASQCSIG